MIPTVSVLFLALAASASPVVEESRHQREILEHYHHLHYIADFSCHHPQPRSVPVHELLSPYQTRGKIFSPKLTVLHRCDVFAGCCEGAKKCGPVHANNVHLPFKITYIEDMGDKRKGDWEIQYYHFDNHTACSCEYSHALYKPSVHHHNDPSHDDGSHPNYYGEHHVKRFEKRPDRKYTDYHHRLYKPEIYQVHEDHDHHDIQKDHNNSGIGDEPVRTHKPAQEEHTDETYYETSFAKRPDQKHENATINPFYLTI